MKPLRVLHVLGGMNRGGVETWLMHVLRHTDHEKVQVHFLVHTNDSAAYDAELRALNAIILRCPHTANPPLYVKRFLHLVKINGPFDVLHSHVHHFSGLVVTLGRIAGIPVRIAHSHSDTTSSESKASAVRRMYLSAMTQMILSNATQGFAVSEPSAIALFGDKWREDPRLRVLYCGIDLKPFQDSFDIPGVRAEFGFAPSDVVFGHVGSFSAVKNHRFFLDIAGSIARIEPRAKFLLVGDGLLRPEIESRAQMLGLEGKVVFAGLRSDIPKLMIAAMDTFIMPSLHEGLPLVIMETQAAGLPCVASDVLTDEAIVDSTLVRRLPLSVGPDEWARVACQVARCRPPFRHDAADVLVGSRFDIMQGIREMNRAYQGNDHAN